MGSVSPTSNFFKQIERPDSLGFIAVILYLVLEGVRLRIREYIRERVITCTYIHISSKICVLETSCVHK